MMRSKGISGISERFRDLSRPKQAALGVCVLLVLFLAVCGVVAVGGGGGESPAAGGDNPDGDLVVNFDDVDEDVGAPEPAAPAGDGPEGEVAEPTLTLEERVNATVEAMTPPTPTPTAVPTPDIAKTVQAEIAAHRGEGAPAVAVNPLDAGVMRSPQLTEAEKEYFAAMGEDLWVASQMYLRLSEVATVDFSDWSLGYLTGRLSFIDGLLGSVRIERREVRRAGLSDVVVSYVEFIDFGIQSLQSAVSELRSAVSVFESSGGEYLDEVEAGDREVLKQHYLQINGLVLDFYSVMSAYGCSACGELFRSPFVLEQ